MENTYIVQASALAAVADAIRTKGETSEQLVFPYGFVSAIENITGGADLNFDVVGGTTQPSNPKENTIWVNTSTAITGWVFSAEEPTVPVSGMVWIATGSPNTMKFNALKENDIQIYPLVANQYSGDTWESVASKIYQNGEWLICGMTYLYNEGDECVSLTGGWSNRAWKRTTADGAPDIAAGTLVKNATNMVWIMSQYRCGVVEILKDIDLTPFSVLHAELSAEVPSNILLAKPSIVVVSRSDTAWSTNAKAKAEFANINFKNGEQIVSVKNINEKCDVLIGVHTYDSITSITIHKVWLT